LQCDQRSAAFGRQEAVHWRIGAFLAAGSVAGSWAGGLLAKEWANVWVYRLLVVVILAEIAQRLHRFGVMILLLNTAEADPGVGETERLGGGVPPG